MSWDSDNKRNLLMHKRTDADIPLANKSFYTKQMQQCKFNIYQWQLWNNRVNCHIMNLFMKGSRCSIFCSLESELYIGIRH